MYADEIDSIRKRSKAADDGPWVTDYSEMSRKTVVRRGSKYLPLTTEFRRALELDEEAERDAEPPSAPRPLSRAQALLVERAQVASGTAPEMTYEAEESGDAAPEGEQGSPVVVGANAEDQDDTCRYRNEELGECIQPGGHSGSHGNDNGRWPKAKS